jgi:hypothetical protein
LIFFLILVALMKKATEDQQPWNPAPFVAP